MEFTYRDKGNNYGAFEYELNGERVAEITWILRDGVMNMDHTYVSDVLRGQGVAKKLLDAAADYARENNLKMNAICSYVVSAFEKSDTYDDLKA
ncbi:GNAT family N-acetyltransferase [Solibacillus daqui]|uniref:GNAT family N-acetyltransferase n=1 Tax=Solibacillus daqui TaxID=2912187 RepID=UPI002365E327|nr:GNAT family N-acetyltransferase [Solibacillus daqui]